MRVCKLHPRAEVGRVRDGAAGADTLPFFSGFRCLSGARGFSFSLGRRETISERKTGMIKDVIRVRKSVNHIAP